MGFFLKWKTDSQRRSSGTLVIIFTIVLLFLGYHSIRFIHDMADRFLEGIAGLLYLLAAAVLVIVLLVIGYRGKSLLAASAVLGRHVRHHRPLADHHPRPDRRPSYLLPGPPDPLTPNGFKAGR